MKFLILCFTKFSSNFAKFKIRNFTKFLQNYENKNFATTLCRSAVRGGEYSPGASSALTKIVLYSSSVYTVFHSVFYNSVEKTIAVTELWSSTLNYLSTGDRWSINDNLINPYFLYTLLETKRDLFV